MKQLVKRIKNNKLLSSLCVLIVGVFVLVLARITFAYLAPSIKDAMNNVVVDSSSVDTLKFIEGDPLSLDATSSTLKEDGTNLVKSSKFSASLLANNNKNTATMNYYVYLQIPENTFVYTDGSTPEIILTVTNPNGDEVTNIDGLTYGTFSGISGFDVTTKSGLFNIANSYEITSNSSDNATIQDWQFTLTYLNLGFDQSGNYGHSMSTKVIMSKEERVLAYHEICDESLLACHVAKQYTGTQGDNNMYYHNSKLENGTRDNSYRYAGSSDTTNNFVCFGYDSTDGTCPTDYLYRIIGVFDGQVKLIKYDYAKASLLGTDGVYYSEYSSSGAGLNGTNKGSNSTAEIGIYPWFSSQTTHTWSNSLLNKTNLNTNYVNNIGSTWSSKIATHTWKVGGNTEANIYQVTASNAYNNEITNPATNTTYDAKVGLMYVSDYGYAAAPSAWTTNLSSYSSSLVTKVNWMYMGLWEWTITPCTNLSYIAVYVHSAGYMNYFAVNRSFAVRPVLYLESSVAYAGGNGTAGSPILIK